MRRFASLTALSLIAFLAMPSGILSAAAVAPGSMMTFNVPIDGLSIAFAKNEDTTTVSGWDGKEWSPWEELHVEDEQDPLTHESNLVLFSHSVSQIRFEEEISEKNIHPIRISNAPTFYKTASLMDGTHHILSRDEWGADPSLLIQSTVAAKPDTQNDGADAPLKQSSQRVQDCKDAYAKYPSEFKSSYAVTENAKGEKLRWPQEYSPKVHLLVVHHTALKVSGDGRTGVDRMRALYQYHAVNRGWGDVGYHFVVDETGQIYEGRSGGDSVVGGHVYCNNVGTIGIAMMGNFDVEQPPQAQVESLQWLLKTLATKYDINLNQNVVFHGKTLPPIVGHRQLISTECPGVYLWSVLDQIRDHVQSGNLDAPVDYPQIEPAPVTGSGGDVTPPNATTGSDGLGALSETNIEARPGGQIIIPILFRAATKSYTANEHIAQVTGTQGMQVWQERDGTFKSTLGDLRIPVPSIDKGESVLLRVKVQLPATRGNAVLLIGSLRYVFAIDGRRVRTQQLLNSFTLRQLSDAPMQTSSVQRTTTAQQPRVAGSIRIVLSRAVAGADHLSIVSSVPVDVNTVRFNAGTMVIKQTGGQCVVQGTDHELIDGLIRLTPVGGSLGIGTNATGASYYRGTLECQIVNGTLALINELPLEDYVAGLAEEPDTEPYEKQRAFAITARTYAKFYMDPSNRKFPGMPYDGSDDPATFQSYAGANIESANPQWLRAARSTAGQVLIFQGAPIKPPYFSSDTGQTKSPSQAGWKNFPFEQIYSSKPDPWCAGMSLNGHGVGMSGCGAKGQANEGKSAEQILQYYYPGTTITRMGSR